MVIDGTISVDVDGGAFTITQSAVTNNGTLSALNGGTMILASNVTGNAGSSINVGANSEVVQSGVTLSGEINQTGDGTFRATASAAHFLFDVTFNGELDLTGINAQERITAGGLALNGSILIDGGSNLVFEGVGGVSRSDTIVVGDTAAGNPVDLDSSGTTTIGNGIVIRGENGAIGGQLKIGGTQTLINDGVVSADVAGATVTILLSAVANNREMSARNGGTLLLQSNVTSNPGGFVEAADGSEVVQSSVTLGGVVNTSGNGKLRATGSSLNRLTGVTLNGDLDPTRWCSWSRT